MSFPIKRSDLPGIILCFILASAAWLLGKSFPIIGGPVFALLIGMILTLAFPAWSKAKKGNYDLNSGVKVTSKKLLQFSIILLGFEMNLFRVMEVGSQSLAVMAFTLSAALLTAVLMGKVLKVDKKMTTLIGVGTAICGGSAIAATAPVIEADEEAIAHAISTIFLFNILAVFLFPPLGRLLGLSDMGFGMWAGTAVNDTSSVVATGVAWSSAVGNTTALTFATIVKLTRTLMIVPITLVLAYLQVRSKAREASLAGSEGHSSTGHVPNQSSPKEKSADTQHFSIAKVFPWFVLGFVLTAMMHTFLPMPEGLGENLTTIGKFMIVMAMAAIGLNTHLVKLLKNGFKPIFLGLCCWFAVASVSLIVQHFMGLL